MFSLCANTKISRTPKEMMNRFDLNNDGVVSDDELSQVNLNKIHNNAYGSDSIYRNNKYFKRIDVDNLRVALNRDKDKKNIININDFKALAFNGVIDENTFSLVELIAVSDTFGEYKDNLALESGVKKPTFRKKEVALAEQQLKNQKGFGELFCNKTMNSPLPTNPY
jgi:hypothetical protein